MRIRALVAIFACLPLAAHAAPADDGATVKAQIDRWMQDTKAWPDVLAALRAQSPAVIAPLYDVADGDDLPRAKMAWKLIANIAAETPAAQRDEISQTLLRRLGTTQHRELRTRNIELLGEIGSAAVVPALKLLVDDRELGAPARVALVHIPGPEAAAALLQAAQQNGVPASQRDALFAALGKRRDQAAVPLLLSELKSGDDAHLCVVLVALAEIGDPAALDGIRPLFHHADRSVRRAAVDATLQLAAKLPDDKAGAVYWQVVESNPEPYQLCGAMTGLARVRDADTLSVAVGALDSPKLDVRSTAEQVLRDFPSPDVMRTLLVRLPQAALKIQVAMLNIITAREKEKATPTLVQYAAAQDSTVRSAALTLLGDVAPPDEKVIALLRDAAQKGSDDVKPVADAAYIRMANRRLTAGETAASLKMFEDALTLATRDDERRLAVTGIGQVGSPDSLPVVIPLLTSPGVRNEAAGAVVAIADTLAAQGKRDEAIDVYKRALGLGSRDLGNRAVQGLRALGVHQDFARAGGFVTDWWLVGPFPNKGNSAFTESFFPESEIQLTKQYDVAGGHFRWQRHETGDIYGVTDLRSIFSPNDDVAAYAYTEVKVDRATAALFKIGSDDGVVCWLNGEKVDSFGGNRALAVDNDTVKVQLRAGVNRILLKILQGKADWGFCLRITDSDSKPLAVADAFAGRDFAREAGFVTHWAVIGPFPNPDNSAAAKSFFPETEVSLDKTYEVDGRKLTWQRRHTEDAGGVTDLRALLRPSDNVAAYAYAEVRVAQATDALLKIGSDDGAICWLNGVKVEENPKTRPLTVDEDVVKVKLTAGVNRILLKVLQGGGDWQFCLRVTDPAGKPLPLQELLTAQQ